MVEGMSRNRSRLLFVLVSCCGTAHRSGLTDVWDGMVVAHEGGGKRQGHLSDALQLKPASCSHLRPETRTGDQNSPAPFAKHTTRLPA